MKRFKRGLAILLSTCMIGGMMPITTSAQEPVSGNTAQTEDTAISAIQALIDALPDADSITEDSAEEVTAQHDAIDEAKAELTDEELAQLDLTRYDAAAAKMMALMGMEGAGEATFAAEEPSFGGGTGTQEDPWLITSQGDLIALAEFLNSGKAEEFDAGNNGIGNCQGYYFKQTADIDLTGVAWEPIGYSGSYYFAGNYDGYGHSITNAVSTGKVDPDGYATAGIFGWVAFGSVENLHVKNANFVATGQNEYSYVGGIAGVCYGSSIKNCSVVDSSLESKRNNNNNCAGSIVGYYTGGTFERCAAENNQVRTMAYGGGFVGEVDDGYNVGNSTFTNCYVAKCTVISETDDSQGTSFSGGFSGEITDSTLTIQNCYVYQTPLSTVGNAVPQGTGVFAGNLWGGSTIADTNCFFGACGTTDRAGTATEKHDEDFTNGTVAGSLGDAFAQARNYPRFKDSPADYSDVDAAIAKVNALNKDNYQDFSGVEVAVKAVVRDKNITKQSEVDAMAKAIEDAIIALVYKDADYTKVDEAIAKVNALKKDNYKDFSGVEAAVNAVKRDKNVTEQSEVDAMAKAIEDAITALVYKDADYAEVDAAIAKAKALNKDNYKDFSGVEAAVNAVNRDKNVTEQSEVDAMAKAIEDAIKALVYKDADYTKVDEAIAKANALNKDNYKDFSSVEVAVNAVVRGKNITEQSEVDKMAKAIEKAIDALEYKGADYTKVDATIAKAKALNKDNYKDFSGVEAAVKAVVRGKNITEQSEVDKMAKAIEKAIDALEYKGADYTKVDAAIAKAKALNKDNFKDFSGVEAAVKAVVRDKNITEQSEVDKMEKAIEDAIAALQYKEANYTKVDAAIAKAKALNKDNYKDFSGVDDAVKAVVRGKDITKQSEVDAMATVIEDAIAALQYKGADYTKVDATIAKANALNKNDYKDFSAVEAAVKAVVRGKDITKQTEVDAMAKAIDDAISVLQYKDADYTKVDAVIAKAPEPSNDYGDSNNTNTNGGRVTGTSDSSKNTDSRNNSDTETKPYIKDDSGKKGWDVISSQLDEAKSGETVTVAMNGTTVVPKDIFDSIKGENVTLVLDMGDGISWKINGKDITDAAGDIDFGVIIGADAGKSIPVDVINNVTGERYSMNLSLAYNGEFGFTARLTINMEAKNTGLYANLFYYNEQTGKLEFVSAGLIDADGNVELEFTHASDYTIVIDAAVMDGGNKDSINTTKDNENAEDNTTIPASNADNAKSDAWNPAIIIIIGICILLIVFGAVIFVRKKSGSEEE